MISELRITDLGVINEATITLHSGFTVVTGETGAGKTMIVTGLGLLLGGRADPKAVRNGADRARVEGCFAVDVAVSDGLSEQVSELGGEIEDGELLVARHLTAAARSRAYVGGTAVPAGVLAEVTEQLLTIHGQSEQIRLGGSERQRELLDRFAGTELTEVAGPYRLAYEQRREVRATLADLRAAAQTRAREIDLLRYGLEEIEKLAPQPQEDVELAAEAIRLQSADDLRISAQAALVALAGADDEAGGALVFTAQARRAIDQASSADPAAAELAKRVAEVGFLLSDLAGDLASYLDALEAQPGRLEWIAERRAGLAGLTRKYGDTVDEVIAWSAEAAQRLVALESSDDQITELAERETALNREIQRLAERLSEIRGRAATGFAERALAELAALAMPHARLEFALSLVPEGPYGVDQVDLLFSANPGSELRSLAKVASGGELSRVRLALEVVLAADHAPGTMVFDEVDAGVGGKVAVEIGRRLAALARHSQVVVVTHLAQVAAFADRHFVVVKEDDGQVTTSGVQEVGPDQQAAELARMMAGLETTESALAHARELVALAAESRTSD